MSKQPTPAIVQTAEAPPPFRILSLDGGGAKGFYTLGVLSEIEAIVGMPLCAKFDLIFGTSTGAIIAALIARGETVGTVRTLYEEHVPTIMKAPNSAKRTRALHALARSVFGETHYDTFKTGIGIVATNWNDERPMIFKASVRQAHGSKGSFEPFFGCSVADAIIASCSAYPFFSRHTVRKGNGDTIELADGGFCANNPTLYAIADATLALKKQHDSLRVVSLGVGSYPQPAVLKRAGRLVTNYALMRHVPGSDFLQKVLGTNTASMDVLRTILFKDVPTIRINDAYVEPIMATDLLEHDLSKLNRLVQKGRISFAQHEARLREFLDA
ncbi:MAG TPA: patatin-like phospholipase family protein [Humisphaera sp.]|nr:patatin-like phospholipase family protein [Humisphaera sp.]